MRSHVVPERLRWSLLAAAAALCGWLACGGDEASVGAGARSAAADAAAARTAKAEPAARTPAPAAPSEEPVGADARATANGAAEPSPAGGDAAAEPAPACRPLTPAELELTLQDDPRFDDPRPPLEDPGFAVLAPLYERLAALVRGQAVDHVRLAMYGDSNLTLDELTGEMRRILQERLGDGGHGWVALGRPWRWYRHMDVRHDTSRRRSWRAIATSTHRVRDGYYGLAGIAAESQGPGAVSWVETADEESPVGTTASRIDFFFLRRPGGAKVAVRIDGNAAAEISTAAEAVSAGFERFPVEEGPHRVEFEPERGGVRLFGAALEREPPGVVVDSLGVSALNLKQLARVDEATREEMLARRRYDLVIFLLGTNLFQPASDPGYAASIVRSYRRALPGLPILFLSPVDHAASVTARSSDRRIVALVDELRKVARDNDCAFWDFHGAMGGELSIVRFRRLGLAHHDLIHFRPPGAALMGRRLLRALWAGFVEYMAAHPEAGCVDPREVR